MNAEAFVEELLTDVPEAGPVLDEHLRDNDVLLLHVFVGDLRRMCETAWGAGDRAILARLLIFLDGALRLGDDYVKEAVAVSFVEDSGWWDPKVEGYIATWPAALAAEVEAQRVRRG